MDLTTESTQNNLDEFMTFSSKDEQEVNSFIRRMYDPLDISTTIWTSAIIVTLSTFINWIVLKIYKERNKDNNKRFVVALAVVDISQCWTMSALDIVESVAFQTENVLFSDVAYLTLMGVVMFFLTGYIVILLMWALERLIAVACPFTVQEKLKVFRKVYIALGATYTLYTIVFGTIIQTRLVR